VAAVVLEALEGGLLPSSEGAPSRGHVLAARFRFGLSSGSGFDWPSTGVRLDMLGSGPTLASMTTGRISGYLSLKISTISLPGSQTQSGK